MKFKYRFLIGLGAALAFPAAAAEKVVILPESITLDGPESRQHVIAVDAVDGIYHGDLG